MTQLAYLVPILGAVGGLPTPEVERCFQEHEYKYAVGTKDEKTYRYRLFVPKLESKSKLPLVVWLHGYGDEEFSLYNRGQLRHIQLVFATSQDCDRQKFFLLAMQCPKPPGAWYSSSGPPQSDEPMTALKALIDLLVTKQPIDPNRISLLGISGGGTSAWEMAIRYPELFSAIAPLGSTGTDNPQIRVLSKVPVWAFHSSGDNPERVRNSVEVVKANGGSAYLTEVPQKQHDCWTQALTEYDVLQWLVVQRRGGWSWWPAGYRNSWQLVLQICIPLLIVYACINEIRRQHRHRSQT
jgi:predicted peptidase